MKVVPATRGNIKRAASILRNGGIVIVPTETVYGIACDATNPDAVQRVYEAKGRPASNPMIVHVHSLEQAKSIAENWPEAASKLAEALWPGPLTMVLKNSNAVAANATANLVTVAIRMPNHQVMLDIIARSKKPLAAPSANQFMNLSPTRVENLDPLLVERVDLVIDGGPCEVGIESTVVDLSQSVPRLLRPGGISREQIERTIDMKLAEPSESDGFRSPGMHKRHYAPKAKVQIVENLDPSQSGLTFDEPNNSGQIKMPMHAVLYAHSLFAALHQLDGQNPDTIFVEAPPWAPEWEAVWDRLNRASEEI